MGEKRPVQNPINLRRQSCMKLTFDIKMSAPGLTKNDQ